MAIVQANYAYSVYPNTTNINMQYGIQYSATQVYSAPTGVANIDLNITYGTLNQSAIVNISPVVFSVPQGNTNYYFSYGYFGLGSINNGGTVTISVKIINLIRIG